MSGLESMEAAGEPDEAWQKLYQRLEQQRGRLGSLGTAQVIARLDLSIPCHSLHTCYAAWAVRYQTVAIAINRRDERSCECDSSMTTCRCSKRGMRTSSKSSLVDLLRLEPCSKWPLSLATASRNLPTAKYGVLQLHLQSP